MVQCGWPFCFWASGRAHSRSRLSGFRAKTDRFTAHRTLHKTSKQSCFQPQAQTPVVLTVQIHPHADSRWLLNQLSCLGDTPSDAACILSIFMHAIAQPISSPQSLAAAEAAGPMISSASRAFQRDLICYDRSSTRLLMIHRTRP